MKRLFLLLFALLPMLASVQCSTFDNNVIRYTTTDNEVLNTEVVCNANLISNTYADGQGVMVFDKPITVIGKSAFDGCTSLESITIPNSVTEIELYAFADCTSLTSVTIGNGVTTIGQGAFYGCTSLKSFYGKLASEDNRCLIKDGVLLAFVPNGLTEYTIPNSVTEIGDYAFYKCTSLKSIKIPNSVTWIGAEAFYGCTSLTSVTIPNSVTSIGYDAFSGCTSLKSITIPNSVTEIEISAFSDCSSLKNIYCKPTTPPTINYQYITEADILAAIALVEMEANTRANTKVKANKKKPLNCKIYVPRASVEAYKTAEGWKEYADRIIGYDF